MSAGRSQRGFTLVEVMLALAILFAGLVVLIRSTAGNIYTAERAYMLGVATDLARGKMYDLEEELRIEGFQELDQELDGDFDDEGWPSIEWEAVIIEPELPDLASLQANQAEEEAEEEGEGEGGRSSSGPGGGAGGGLFGGAMGGAGAGAAGAGGESSGASMIPPQMFTMVQEVLETSVRKVELTVTWDTAGTEESMLVEAYFTEPKAMGQVIPGAGSGGGLPGPRGGGEDGDDGEDGDAQEGGGGDDRGGGDGRGGGARPSPGSGRR